MATALSTTRTRRLQAAAILTGQPLSGKPLAKVVMAKRRQSINPFESWDAYRAKASAHASAPRAKGAPPCWQDFELVLAWAQLTTRDLSQRICALEGAAGLRTETEVEEARATAKRKQLRLSLVGDITKDRVAQLIDRIKAVDPETPIKLTLDSRGGNLDAAYDLADVLSRHKAGVHCHAISNCSSAAVALMLSAKKRTAEPGCSLVLHRPSLAHRPSALLDERVEGALDNSAHGMAKLLERRTGTSADVFKPFLATARGKRLTSAEAVELGIIHALTPISRKGKR